MIIVFFSIFEKTVIGTLSGIRIYLNVLGKRNFTINVMFCYKKYNYRKATVLMEDSVQFNFKLFLGLK